MAISEAELDQIEARCNAATEGSFISEDCGTQNESLWAVKVQETLEFVGDFQREEDTDFWITARKDIPRLIAALRASKDQERVFSSIRTGLEIERDTNNELLQLANHEAKSLRAQRDEVWDQAIEIAKQPINTLGWGSASGGVAQKVIVAALIAARDAPEGEKP